MDRYGIYNNCFWIEDCLDLLFGRINIAMATINRKRQNQLNVKCARSRIHLLNPTPGDGRTCTGKIFLVGFVNWDNIYKPFNNDRDNNNNNNSNSNNDDDDDDSNNNNNNNNSLRSKGLSNIRRAVLGNAEDARSTLLAREARAARVSLILHLAP